MESDRTSVVDLWNNVFHHTDFHNDPERSIDMKLRHGDNLLFVAEIDGKLVGTILVGFDGHRGWIYSLAVEPDHRKKGIGSLLVKKAIQELKALGCLKVNLQIEGDNSGTVSFYKKLGFAVEDRISMGKKLY